MSESFQAHVSITTVNGANPTVNGTPKRCTPPTRTAEGRFGFVTAEGIATSAADIAANIVNGVAGAVVNVAKGANDFTWEIQVFTVVAGVLTLDDLPGAIINVTLKRVNPA